MWLNLKCQKKLFAFFLLEVSLYVIVQKAITTPYPYRRGVFLGGWGKRVREHKRKALYCWAGDIMEGHTGRLPHICVQRSQRKDHNNQTTRPRHWAGIFNLIHSSVSNYSSLNKGIRTNTFQKGASLTWLINWLTYKAHQITKHGCDLVKRIWHHFGRVIDINDIVSGVLISRTLFRRVIDINDMVSGVLISRNFFGGLLISMTWFWESWISRTLFGRVIDINDMVSQVLGISRKLFGGVIDI